MPNRAIDTTAPESTSALIMDIDATMVGLSWTAPFDPEDADADAPDLDPSIDHFHVQLSTTSNYSNVYREDRKVGGTSRSFRVPVPQFYGQLQANITNVATTFDVFENQDPVTTGANIHPVGLPFDIVIGSEVIRITTRVFVSGNRYTYTGVRGQNGTSNVSHNVGDVLKSQLYARVRSVDALGNHQAEAVGGDHGWITTSGQRGEPPVPAFAALTIKQTAATTVSVSASFTSVNFADPVDSYTLQLQVADTTGFSTPDIIERTVTDPQNGTSTLTQIFTGIKLGRWVRVRGRSITANGTVSNWSAFYTSSAGIRAVPATMPAPASVTAAANTDAIVVTIVPPTDPVNTTQPDQRIKFFEVEINSSSGFGGGTIIKNYTLQNGLTAQAVTQVVYSTTAYGTDHYVRAKSVDASGTIASGVVNYGAPTAVRPVRGQSDGVAPSSSPAATLTPGQNQLVATWPAATGTTDPITYEVYLDIATPASVVAAKKVGETTALAFTIKATGPGVVISTTSESSNTATYNTAADHGLHTGETVTIVGVGVGDYNGTFFVNTTPTTSSFTVILGPSGLSSSSGGVVIGGVPLEYTRTYYARLIAKDIDGAAAAGTTSAGVIPSQARTVDIGTGAIEDTNIQGGSVSTGKLSAVLILASKILAGLEDNQRIELDQNGLREYGQPEKQYVVQKATISGADVTFTTALASDPETAVNHAFLVGEKVVISGMSAAFNGTWDVKSTTSNTVTATVTGSLDVTLDRFGQTILLNTMDAGSQDSTILVGDTGSGDQWNTVTIGATSTLTYDNAHPAVNSLMGAKVHVGSANPTYLQWDSSQTDVTEAWARAYFYVPSLPGSNFAMMQFLNTLGNNTVLVRISSTGKFEIGYALGGTAGAASTMTVPVNKLFRLELHALASATVGQAHVKIFTTDPEGLAPDETLTTTGVNNGASSIDRVRYGATNNLSLTNFDLYMDSAAYSDLGWIGPETGVETITSTAPQTLALPIGGDAVFTGSVRATDLTVLGGLTMAGTDNIMEAGSVLTMRRGIQQSQAKPALGIDWDAIPFPFYGVLGGSKKVQGQIVSDGRTRQNLFYDAAGFGSQATYLVAEMYPDSNGAPHYDIVEYRASDMALLRTVRDGTPLASAPYGLVRMDSSGGTVKRIYVLNRFVNEYSILIYDQVSGAFLKQVKPLASNPGANGQPVLGTDGTNLLLGYPGAITANRYNLIIQKIDAAGANTGGTLTLTNHDYGIFTVFTSLVSAEGFYWLTFYNDWVYNNIAHPFNTTTGAYIPNKEFPTPGQPMGLTFGAGSKFVSVVGNSLRLHTDWKWTTESARYWLRYTWYDDTGVPPTARANNAASPPANDFETTPSGYVSGAGASMETNSIIMSRRAKLVVTTPPLPVGADFSGIYMYRGANDDASATLANYKRQADTPVSTAQLLNYDTAGSAPPTASNFPTGANAEFRSDSNLPLLRANGYARVKVRRNSNQAGVVAATDTSVLWDAENADTDNFFYRGSGVTISSASWVSGTATYITAEDHGWDVGYNVTVTGIVNSPASPNGYNITGVITAVTHGSTTPSFSLAIVSNAGTYSSGGSAALNTYGDGSQSDIHIPSGFGSAQYLLVASCQWASNATGTYRKFFIEHDIGAGFILLNQALDYKTPVNGQVTTHYISKLVDLIGGEKLRARVNHDASTNRTVSDADLTLILLGPQ